MSDFLTFVAGMLAMAAIIYHKCVCSAVAWVRAKWQAFRGTTPPAAPPSV